MIRDHKKDIAAFQKQAKNGSDADLKSFAEKALPRATSSRPGRLRPRSKAVVRRPGRLHRLEL